MILGNYPGFFSVGEVRFFWEYWQETERLCGCGALLRECDFWTAVAVRLTAQNINLQEMSQMARQVDRTRHIPRLMFPLRNKQALPDSFTTNTKKLYEAIWQEAGQPMIIDSSKVPSHLHILKRTALDIRVLHLVRDGRAVAYSWNKRQKQELGLRQQKNYMPHHSLTRALITWLVENAYTSIIGQKFNTYTVVRYEDMTQNFAVILQKAFQDLALSTTNLSFSNNNTIAIKPTHSVGGNPLRFQKRSIDLRLDEEWRQEMPPKQQLALGLLGLPLMQQYGYKVREAVVK